MDQHINQNMVWESMTPEEKRINLFFQQKNTLDMFLERHAISQAQYDKSLHDLIIKMKIPPEALNGTLKDHHNN